MRQHVNGNSRQKDSKCHNLALPAVMLVSGLSSKAAGLIAASVAEFIPGILTLIFLPHIDLGKILS